MRAAELVVITTYQEISRWLGENDPTTPQRMKKILQEEEHAEDIVDLPVK
jgi:bacterioferritin